MVQILTREQYHKKKWEVDIYGQDNCPFCHDDDNNNTIVWKWKYWFLVHNLAPYSWNEKHLMALPYEHKKLSIELNDNELLELKDVHKFVKDWFWDEHYFSCTRETLWHRSVEHIHIHFIPGRLQWKYLRKMLENQGYPIHQELDINEKKYNKKWERI